MDLNLTKKKVLVTGGSSGIGKIIVKMLEEEGCKVMVLDKKVNINVLNELDIYLDDYWKPCDILINNVGGGGSWGNNTYEEFTEWDDVYELNAGAARKLTMRFLKQNKKWGRVITISSIYGKEAGGRPWFNMAKAAQISLMNNLAGKYKGITFNTICPGHIDVGKPFPDNPETIGSPEDVASLAVFLCSDLAKHINGSCITVDGGESKSI